MAVGHRPVNPIAGKMGHTLRRAISIALAGTTLSAATAAQALQLGEIAVQSALGEPLRARVPVEIRSGEFLGTSCVRALGAGDGVMARVPQLSLRTPEASVAGSYEILLTSTGRLYEPMYEIEIEVRCPGTALLVRQYVLMLDLPGVLPSAAALVAAPVPEPSPLRDPVPAVPTIQVAPAPTTDTPRRRPRVLDRATPAPPIAGGTLYRVASGDTLSSIAARARGGAGLWDTADRIFLANPGAFIDANPDLIKLGSEILIPEPPAADASKPATPEAPTVAATPLQDSAGPAPGTGAGRAALDEADASATADPAAPPAAEAEASAAAVPTAPPTDEPEPLPIADQAVPEADVQPAADAPVALAPVAVPAPGPAAPAPREDSGTPTWLAGVLGLLLGIGMSVALLRHRLLTALRSLRPGRRWHGSALQPTDAVSQSPLVLPEVSRQALHESTMVVEEHHQEQGYGAPGPPIADAPEDTAPESDLARLFADEPLNSDTEPEFDVAALAASGELDLDLSGASPDVILDAEIGWIGDESGHSPTVATPALDEVASGDTVERPDLTTMSHRATTDEEISRTLEEALQLLESDYENELTGSQVIDNQGVRQALEEGSEDPLIRTGTDQRFGRR